MSAQTYRRFTGLLAAALLLTSAGLAMAQGTSLAFGQGKGDRNAPIHIQSETLSVSQKDGTAVFEGKVVIQQDTLKLSAAQVQVKYDDAGSAIESLQATGGVTLVSGTDSAEAETADYQVTSGKIAMSGSVLLVSGPNTIAADRMDLDVTSGQAQMQGNVRTVLRQQGDK
ncbi:lipopolysaccharide transport periplasmic protein LptA [Pseudooceanicola sp. CBS1P-1]|uniref:Lipopolysaccharide transport periplasmic protein LptA n=1 Tax=Pseudooceanicola albus TaxID=2692189 RepID=A0A6L7FX32_9RHOB|nr:MULTISPECIES: LptA/OstA family protein [Pseudooceanicola]MBT9383903.1 lipopolysaccharide transport periplasmic protein LptA [Pseudooceanicola endophyticus]MXN16684.1 lipopolysaccharide transport periplasmic protein LptA [Pseudooceanicola albus]